MDDYLAIYQLHVQSADRLDERRDATTRSHGSMCMIIASAAAGTFSLFPVVSVALCVFLVIVAVSWRTTLQSLTAKLTAKHALLVEMENKDKVPGRFLIREREYWERSGKQPLQKALDKAPIAFCCLGVIGFLAIMTYLICPFLCE